MSRIKMNLYKPFALFVGALLLTLCLTNAATAQAKGLIEEGTTITVQASEPIDVDYSNGRQTFKGTVAENVMNRNGRLAIPRGAHIEMVVSETSRNSLTLHLTDINLYGEHFTLRPGDTMVTASGRQVSVSGRRIHVPAESLLSFELERPLRLGDASDARPNKPAVEEQDSPAYRAGVAAGRADAERNVRRDARSDRWTAMQDRRDYEAGYNRGYEEVGGSRNNAPAATVRIDRGNNVSWQAPAGSKVFVQVDNNPIQVFADGASGNQVAPWIQRGHVYVFMVRDASGNEIARERLDLRR